MKLLKSKKSKSKEKVSASSIGDEDWEKRHQRNSNYYDDSSDSNDSIDILNRKSGREETVSSNNIDAEDLPRQRSSIWKSWKKMSWHVVRGSWSTMQLYRSGTGSLAALPQKKTCACTMVMDAKLISV